MDTDFGVLPGAAEMRVYVAGVVDRLTARSRLPLDYSVASLRIVDFMVDGVRRGRPEVGRVAGLLQGLGAYAGEVIVRRAGARWVDLDPEQRELFGQPVGIRMPDGRVWNPLGKVVNRFELGGPEESVQRFYLLLHGRARKAAAPDAPPVVCC
ncbi:hypothetical protein [Streptomyces sp. V1I1]|jgi:hypothetical protein|uniref:hypothetical protein n=1 Tax=Streptomyces sp. V1I1 TaxID=3042272 RepID=UPI00278AE049|nr:hypothetical protein [Streptomyces sp. V1I1]MDQ0941230.1 hypothetical protein [Streptomyces sp. V1I1]